MVGEARAAGKGSPRVGEPHGIPAAISDSRPAPFLPPELRPFTGVIEPATLAAAAARSRRLGVGADEVLVACGQMEAGEATRRLAAALGLPIAELGPDDAPKDPAVVPAVIRTGVLLDVSGEKPRFTVAAQGRAMRRIARAFRTDRDLVSRVRLVAPAALRRHLLATCGAAVTRHAVQSLAEGDPLKSASTLRPGRALAAGTLVLGLPLAILLAAAPWAGLLAVQAALSLLFLAWISLRLAGSFYPPLPDAEPDIGDRNLPIYSILVPLYREAASVPGLAAALGRLDYPPEKLDIKLVVEADDAETRAAIAALPLPPHIEELAVPDIGPRTKPKALDVALPFSRGAFVAVYDAEDLPEPDQLRRALAAFREGGRKVACVQARLCVDNGNESWIAAHFAAEYAGQFDVLMPMLSAVGLPILLGGTSNHFRRDVLERVGAWDPFNVTEDADLGIRLARAGWRTRVIASSTYEEAPVTLGAWIGQRTRWLKGWAQTLMVHGRRPRALVRDIGWGQTAALVVLTAGPFASALVHPLCTAMLAGDLLRGVIGLPRETLAEALTAALTYSTLAAGYAGAALLAVVGVRRRGGGVPWRVILTIPAYWLLLSVAAWRAVIELVRRPYFWRKTEHGLSRRRAVHTPP